MENQNPDPNHHPNVGSNNNSNHSQKSLKRSSNSHISMSDTESQTSQLDSFHSPLRFDSPLRSDDPYFQPSPPNSRALVSVEKYFSPRKQPSSEHVSYPNTPGTPPPPPPPVTTVKGKKAKAGTSIPPPPPPVYNYNKAAVREGVTTKVGRGDEEVGELEEGGVGGERRSRAAVSSILNRKRDTMLKRAALGFRVCEVIVCVVSFSVMAADKTQGWAGDSFDRYREYRYCLAMNVIGFAYAAFQAFDLSYHLATGKHFISHHLRYHFDFFMDQVLAYLLISASSSAATRVDDWVSNWGKDTFTEMATASIGMSFLGFFAFAISSLISGSNLCNRESN